MLFSLLNVLYFTWCSFEIAIISSGNPKNLEFGNSNYFHPSTKCEYRIAPNCHFSRNAIYVTHTLIYLRLNHEQFCYKKSFLHIHCDLRSILLMKAQRKAGIRVVVVVFFFL